MTSNFTQFLRGKIKHTSIAVVASHLWGNPLPQYLNVITNATNHAIVNTGATSIFIMDGVDVDNKQIATKPLTINLPDGTKVMLTHVCNIHIPGLPTVLIGHIVPLLTTVSLISICPLCKAGCEVVFDNDKCKVLYNNNFILTGYKDPRTDLWTLPIHTKVCTAPRPTVRPRPGPCVGHAPHLQIVASDAHTGICFAAFTHSVHTQANTVKFAHQSLCNPKISTLLKPVCKGFLKGCPNMTEKLILKYLNASPATVKDHMKHPCHGIWSIQQKPYTRTHVLPIATALMAPLVLPLVDTVPVYPCPAYRAWLEPNLIAMDDDNLIANIFCFGAFADKNCSIVYHNLTGLFLFMSFEGSVCSTTMSQTPSSSHLFWGWST